jgi:hypothetical protein
MEKKGEILSQKVNRIGTTRDGKTLLAIYEALESMPCVKCSKVIEVGNNCTRVYNGRQHGKQFLCVKCRPLNVVNKGPKKTPLDFYIETRAWFDDANGDAAALVEKIARAAGYEFFKHTRSYANMVGWHIAKRDKLLSDRYFFLLNESADKFPVKEFMMINFGE